MDKIAGNKGSAPEAGRTAKGAGIASQKAFATGKAYPHRTTDRKRRVVRAIGPAGFASAIREPAA